MVPLWAEVAWATQAVAPELHLAEVSSVQQPRLAEVAESKNLALANPIPEGHSALVQYKIELTELAGRGLPRQGFFAALVLLRDCRQKLSSKPPWRYQLPTARLAPEKNSESARLQWAQMAHQKMVLPRALARGRLEVSALAPVLA